MAFMNFFGQKQNITSVSTLAIFQYSKPRGIDRGAHWMLDIKTDVVDLGKSDDLI